MGVVLWKPLYILSVGMFLLSLALLPFSMMWSVITIIALVSLWTRIPGFIHYLFNQITMHDFFGYIIAGTVGVPIGILFIIFELWVARIFGPMEWTPYTFRATISGIVAVLFVPMIVSHFGGLTTMGFIYFQIIQYVVYYILIALFYVDEIMIEIMCFPGSFFFDFILTVNLFGVFGASISDMMKNGIESGWPFIIFAGIIIALFYLSKNAMTFGNFINDGMKKIFFTDKRQKRLDEELKRRKDAEEAELKKYERFLNG